MDSRERCLEREGKREKPDLTHLPLVHSHRGPGSAHEEHNHSEPPEVKVENDQCRLSPVQKPRNREGERERKQGGGMGSGRREERDIWSTLGLRDCLHGPKREREGEKERHRHTHTHT